MMKKHKILWVALFIFALLGTRPSLLCADHDRAGNLFPAALTIHSTDRLHAFQTMTGNMFVNIYKSSDMKVFFAPLTGVWQTGAGFYRILLPGLTTTMEWCANLHWTSQTKPFSGIDFPKESFLKADQTAVLAGVDQTALVTHDENRPILANLRHQDLYDGLISLSYPIAAARSLTITPMVSYSFAVNGASRQEHRNRRINNTSDTIVYGGIHIIFTF